MKLGDKVTKLVGYNPYGVSGEPDRLMTGEVVYIHPRGRYYTAEFICGNGKRFRESFQMEGDANGRAGGAPAEAAGE